MTQDDLFQTATSYPAAILASHLVRPGSDEARKMTAISGRKYLPLLKQSGRVGLFARMWLDTSLWASTKCYLTWQIKPVTKSKHFVLELWPSMPRTADSESGLWRTPAAANGSQGPKSKAHYQKCLKSHESMITLVDQARHTPQMWPTPNANEDAAGTPNGKMQAMLGNHPDVRGTTPEEWAQGSLNPAWVEWLMGYPPGWTNLETSQE